MAVATRGPPERWRRLLDNLQNLPLRILALSGSLRRGSSNVVVLKTLAERAGPETTITLFPLNDVPLYNGDDDTDNPPPAVAALRNAVAASDGLIIGTPEYNHGTTGVLKNAIDWASRPAATSSLKGKNALIISSSPGAIGGARAYAQVSDALIGALARPVVRRQLNVAGVDQKISGGRLVDEPTVTLLLAGLADLVAEIHLRALLNA
jgi:chromate reductase, NAD(P)H dehydrogenase (quinone)